MMKTILEIYYLRIAGKRIRYQRKQVNLSRKGSDPAKLIWSHIRQRKQGKPAEEHEFVVHSTSWRYERPGKVLLTYVAYFDELTFDKRKTRSISLKSLRTITRKSKKPRSQAELEKKVVSHAIRHIAFLIKTDDEIDFESAMTPETMETFEKLWASLAGRVLRGKEQRVFPYPTSRFFDVVICITIFASNVEL
jgi:hypothetical protein